jgi:hypothetical protein
MSCRTLCSGVALLISIFAVQRSSPAQESSASTIPADGRVIGTVVDEKGGMPISGALVMLGDGRVTETDVAGRFLFLHVRPGAHEIAAVAKGCAHAAGGFNLVSGRDALLRLEVVPPVQGPPADRAGATASRAITPAQLASLGSRSALDALMQYHASLFDVKGTRLVLRARTRGFDEVVEPLLVLDGVRMEGMVAMALADLHAEDLERIQIHLGSVASWQFQPGGAAAVIEITTRKGLTPVVHAQQSPDQCVNWKAR